MKPIFKEFRNYLIGTQSRKYSTAENYISILTKIENAVQKPITEFSKDDLQQYFITQRGKKKINTIRSEQTAIRRFFLWYSEKYDVDDPAQELKPIRKEIIEPDILTPKELQILVQTCGSKKFINMRNAAMIVFLADTGVRLSELCQLKIGNIELKKNNFIAHIRGDTKYHRQRSIPFCELREGDLVAEYWSMYWQTIKFHYKYRESEPLFQSTRERGKALSRNTIQKNIKLIVEKANITKNISPHSFRHFYATHSVMNQMNLQVLRHRLGHASLESTSKYVHLADVSSDNSLKQNPLRGIKTPFKGKTSGFVKAIKVINEK